jgi:hypothetical protein
MGCFINVFIMRYDIVVRSDTELFFVIFALSVNTGRHLSVPLCIDR